MIAAGKKVSIKSRVLAKEALNVDSYKGIVRMVEAVLLITLVVETAGALLSFPVLDVYKRQSQKCITDAPAHGISFIACRGERTDYLSVSYTHLDVYKRQP